MRYLYTVYLLLFATIGHSQEIDSANGQLELIIIKAYEQRRQLKDVPAAVGYLNQNALQRFGPTSIVQAVNTLPGVRMEERSPGSFRLNIRGSALRSPFGVRNVKVYFNDIPYTDPGGQTYLNGLGFYNFQSVEIIKGPGSSLYGAGTGGVMLIESLNAYEPAGSVVEAGVGSFGFKSLYGAHTIANETATNKISFQHQESNGFREQSALKRNILSWNGRFTVTNNSQLTTTFLYSDLSYETPGALTATEYNSNPKSARPAGGGFPSAVNAQASINQKTFLAGLSYRQNLTDALSYAATAYGMFTELRNPAIRNYGKNEDPNVGGRASLTYSKNSFRLIAGGELQQGFSSVSVFRNKQGRADSLQSLDEVRIRQSLMFLQASVEKRGWELTAGGGLNFLAVSIERNFPSPTPVLKRNFSNQFAPRIALSKRWQKTTLYASIAKGFSPPTTNEVLPSGSELNLSLNPETGINYDLGVRGKISDLSFDVNAFYFSLQNTIVQRRDAGGGDFFINAGKTSQTGIETSLSYPFLKTASFSGQSTAWISHTWHQFRYKEFRQLNQDYSGKRLPGIAPHTLAAGLDMHLKSGFIGGLGYYFSDRIALNDGNTDYAPAYHLLHARLGYEKVAGDKWQFRLTAGVENLLDRKYSLGNDINAFGGRYYNVAPGRNFYLTLRIQRAAKKVAQ